MCLPLRGDLPGEMRASPGKSYGKYIEINDVKNPQKKSYQNPIKHMMF
jgi:hypothetical protein